MSLEAQSTGFELLEQISTGDFAVGRSLKGEGTYIYLRLIHVDVRQQPTASALP